MIKFCDRRPDQDCPGTVSCLLTPRYSLQDVMGAVRCERESTADDRRSAVRHVTLPRPIPRRPRLQMPMLLLPLLLPLQPQLHATR